MEIDTPMDFCLEIQNRTTFSQAIEIVHHTLATATLSIEKDEEPNSVIMRIDAMDSSHCCAVKMRFKCTGMVIPQGIVVSLKLKTLLALLKTTPNSETIKICRATGADNVQLKCLPNMGSETHQYNMKTLDEEYNPVPINDIESSLTVEFDTQKLKSYIRVAKDIRSEVIRLRIFSRDQQNIIFCLSCEGEESDGQWEYHFTNQVSDNGTYQFCIAPESKAKVPVEAMYDASFDVKFLDQFVRAMDRSSVVMAMCNDHPLVIEYNLGQEDASVKFVLAPKTT